MTVATRSIWRCGLTAIDLIPHPFIRIPTFDQGLSGFFGVSGHSQTSLAQRSK